MLQFTSSKFKAENDPTIGVEFGSKIVTLDEKTLKLQIWDTVHLTIYPNYPRPAKRASDLLPAPISEGKKLALF